MHLHVHVRTFAGACGKFVAWKTRAFAETPFLINLVEGRYFDKSGNYDRITFVTTKRVTFSPINPSFG